MNISLKPWIVGVRVKLSDQNFETLLNFQKIVGYMMEIHMDTYVGVHQGIYIYVKWRRGSVYIYTQYIYIHTLHILMIFYFYKACIMKVIYVHK